MDYRDENKMSKLGLKGEFRMAKQHKIAILGLEHWYWAYPIAGAVSAMKDAELTYVIGEDEEQTQKTADLMRAKHWGTDYRIALEDPEVDIVVIMPTTNRHEELACLLYTSDAADE